MKTFSSLAIVSSLITAAHAGDFDIFDFEGWYGGGLSTNGAVARPPGSRLALKMLMKCEESEGFQGKNCEMVLRGPSGFSLCDDPSPFVPGSGVIFQGKFIEDQFNEDTGVASFNINRVVCDGTEVQQFTVPTGPAGGFIVPFNHAAPLKLKLIPGKSEKYIKGIELTITDPMQMNTETSRFYKLGGGMKSD